MYCLSWPGSLFLHHKLGISLKVVQDDEAGVYVATSPDVDGLVIEADSVDMLMSELKSLIPELVKDKAVFLDCVFPALRLA